MVVVSLLLCFCGVLGGGFFLCVVVLFALFVFPHQLNKFKQNLFG